MRGALVTPRLLLSCFFLLSGAGMLRAQLGFQGAEWMTNGSDAQRSFSIPTDPAISVERLRTPGFQLLWKTKLNPIPSPTPGPTPSNDAPQVNSLTPAILMDRYIGYRGFRSFAFVAGSSNTVYAIDSDLNRIEWKTKLPVPAPAAGSLTCPGGLTSPIARATTANYPAPATFGGLGGRGGPAASGVGEPSQGAITIPAALAASAAAAAAPGGGPPRLRLPVLIYVLAGDGMLHTLYISNGTEAEPPMKFLPPNANAQGLVVIDGAAYAASHSCNGAPAGVWALDIASKQVAVWKPPRVDISGDIAGSGGPAFGPDGTVYATTTAGALVALDPKTLAIKDTYESGQDFTSSPVVFQYKARNLIAAATRDGRIHVLDSASLATPLFKTPADSANFAPGALASWQSSDGVRWLLAASGGAANGAVTAWKIVERDGAIALEPGWRSRDLMSPLTPMIINGVVFAVSSRAGRPAENAVLYALDGATGKVLWDSGKSITSFVHSGGLSGGAGQLYLETSDQTLYAFGFPVEH
jgi:outer membrane protein assembly factor BamB